MRCGWTYEEKTAISTVARRRARASRRGRRSGRGRGGEGRRMVDKRSKTLVNRSLRFFFLGNCLWRFMAKIRQQKKSQIWSCISFFIIYVGLAKIYSIITCCWKWIIPCAYKITSYSFGTKSLQTVFVMTIRPLVYIYSNHPDGTEILTIRRKDEPP